MIFDLQNITISYWGASSTGAEVSFASGPLLGLRRLFLVGVKAIEQIAPFALPLDLWLPDIPYKLS
jgi:hypothetical protein